MIIVNTSPNKLIQIGYEGEDKVTILRFSYSEKWLENGDGIFTVRVLRNGENQAYNAQVIKDDRENYTIDMTVTDIELSKKGYGEMQLVYTGADFVKKSPVYKYYVSRSVDEAVDPPESDVYTQIIESLADLRVDFNELADMVSEINDDIGDLTELTTANKLNIVESINEVNAKGFVSVDDELSDTSTNPVQNKVITSRIASAESAIQGKADIQTVTTLSDTVADLQAGKADKSYVDDSLIDKVSDVQINGVSIVDNGVAEIPLAKTTEVGLVKIGFHGISVNSDGGIYINSASTASMKGGVNSYNPVAPVRQHEATFYGLAKVAGHDEKDSTLPVGEYTSEAKTAIQIMLDVPSTATVSALADEVNGLDEDIQGLQTTVQSKADTATVTALSGTVSGLQTTVQSKADTSTVTALSGTVSALSDAAQQYMEQTSAALSDLEDYKANTSDVSYELATKADKSYVDTQLATKASTQTVSDLSDDVSDLQTGLAGKVGDVQVNGASIVSNGVAKITAGAGLSFVGNTIKANTASETAIKGGDVGGMLLNPTRQHYSAFYGLAKAAGHDERSSTLPVGTYTDEAKIAIQKMLGIYEAPWELIREDTFTNAEEADHIITADADGNAFELTDLVLAFWLPKQSTYAKKGSYGQVRFMKNGATVVTTESSAWEQQANANPKGFMVSMEDHNGMVFVRQHVNALFGYTASMTMRIPQNFDMTSGQTSIKFAGSDFYVDSINIVAVTGTGHYRLYGKRKWQ